MAWTHRSWNLLPADGERAESLAAACRLEPLVAQCLLHRGLRDPQAVARFLTPDLATLGDPDCLPDMPAAAERLKAAAALGEPIALFGDSDVDGITATAILLECLQARGATVTTRISNRIEDGYGVPASVVAAWRRAKPGVVVLIDCGTNQPHEVAALTRQGIDVIILDHHVPLDPSPLPYAFVNPYRGPAPSPGLCSAGVALKLVQALSDGQMDEVQGALDLAALGTLADYAPLIGDNRVIVTAGLPRIAQTRRLGLRRLCEAVEMTSASAEQVLKRLIPRLNAAGRLGDAAPVLEALTTRAPEVAERLAERLGAAHTMTKSLHQKILMQACEQVNRTSFKEQLVMVVGGQGWHPGLMGPVAAQLAERYARPAIAIALDEEGAGVGSGRSISGFNLVEALQACGGLLMRYGGHPQACGLSIHAERLGRFRQEINQHAAGYLSTGQLTRTMRVDAATMLERLTAAVGDQMQRCAPFGPGNPKPLMLLSGLWLERETSRRGWVRHGQRRLRLWGALDGFAAGERYDVLVSPMRKDDELVLSLADARAAITPL